MINFSPVKEKLGETSAHLFKTFFVYGVIALSLIVTKVLVARLYGQEELGIFTYFFSLVSLIFLFIDFGLAEALTQTIAKEPEKLKNTVQWGLFFQFIALMLFVLLWLFLVKNPTLQLLSIPIILFMGAHILFYFAFSIFRGFKQFVWGSFYSLINRIIFILFIIILFLFSANFVFVLISLSLSSIITVLISYPRLKQFYKNIPQTKKIEIYGYLKLAFCLFLMQVGIYSLSYISEIIIGYLADFNSLGFYSAHTSITNIIRLIANVFPVVILPLAVMKKYKLSKSLKKILFWLVPFAVVVLIANYLLVPILYGREYQNFILPFILVISSSLMVIHSYLNSVFMGENNFSAFYLKIIGLDFFLSLIFNSTLNIYLILKLGIIGAPTALGITLLLKIILNIYAIRKVRKDSVIGNLENITNEKLN